MLATYRTTGLATVLLAEIERKDAGSKGATGRAAVRKAPDGTLRVVGVADKGSGRFDTAGEAVAVTPIGRMAFPGNVLAEFEEVGRGLGRVSSSTMCRCSSASLGATPSPVSSARPTFSMSASRKATVTRLQPHLPKPDSCGSPVSATFNHQLLEFTSVDPARLRDTHALSGLVVAAAGAVGMPSLGPPVVARAREGLPWHCSVSRATSCCTVRPTREPAWSRSSPGPPPMSARGSR